jgi:hypothetical protein
MCYSSIRRDALKKTLKNYRAKKNKPLDNYQIGIGLLDYGLLYKTGFIQKLRKIGLLKNFHLLTPEKLDMDLSLAEKCGVKEVTIYGLGGLNDEFVDILRRYSSKQTTTSITLNQHKMNKHIFSRPVYISTYNLLNYQIHIH